MTVIQELLALSPLRQTPYLLASLDSIGSMTGRYRFSVLNVSVFSA